MKFQVEDRGSIELIAPIVPHVIISISDTPDTRKDLSGTATTLDVLQMDFHDIDAPKADMKHFTEADATVILNFYLRYRDEVDLFVAHCNAGMCRSPAVIAALQKIHTGDDNIWFKTKKPNSLVYRTILFTAFDKGFYNPHSQPIWRAQ